MIINNRSLAPGQARVRACRLPHDLRWNIAQLKYSTKSSNELWGNDEQYNFTSTVQC